uniref:hypothetical protein n=1 Tax=Enterococcus faecium TaxID=1352 RepID=UPI00164F646C
AHRTLTGLQPLVERPVRTALREVADRFTKAVEALPAGSSREHMTRLAGDLRVWWGEHGRPALRALLALYEAAVDAVARWLGVAAPAGYTDLPAQFDADRFKLPQPVQGYLAAVETRLGYVGDNLRDTVVRAAAAA